MIYYQSAQKKLSYAMVRFSKQKAQNYMQDVANYFQQFNLFHSMRTFWKQKGGRKHLLFSLVL